MEFQESRSEFKVLKLIDGSDILCKVLSEYDDAIVVECPMSVTKQIVSEKRDHMVEHTGLQKWMSFTNDINFVIERSKGNRINLTNELNKIANFCQDKKSVEIDEILKLTNLADNYNFSELVLGRILYYQSRG